MLELQNVCKTFNPGTSNEVKALCGVDLTIDEGSWVIVIGTNGSGKSTLLNALAGSFPVDAGTIHLADQDIQMTDEIVCREKLTTLMVTHSMHQGANLGDRLIMMHRGRIIHDFRGADKRRLRVNDLLARFEELRRADQLDETAADMLRRAYV